jgi:GGDEF domain-containing protein
MVSIRESITELEQCRQARDVAVECYLAAIRNAAHYAIELEPEITEPHRQLLNKLAGEAARAGVPALPESRATLRGLLRDYRDRAAQYLRNLREELTSTARSLQEILNTLSEIDGEQDSRMRTAVARLRQFSDPGVLSAATTIEDSLEHLRKQHQLIVSQFLVEIRMLHKRIDSLERSASIDGLSKLLNRREIEERIRILAESGFGLLLIKVSGFHAAEMKFSETVAAELAGAFIRRLRNSLPANAVIARWNEEDFVALLPGILKADIEGNAHWITDHLGGIYACLQGGKTVRPELEIAVDAVLSSEEPAGSMLQHLEAFFEGR